MGYPISAKTAWRPDFERLNSRLGKVARLIFVNSPHNPAGTELSAQEMSTLIWAASRENMVVVNDAAYLSLPEREPVSLLSSQGGRRVGVEVYSFSYLLGLPYLPFGFVAGNRDVISALKQTARLMPSIPPRFLTELVSSSLKTFPSASLQAVRKEIARTAGPAEHLMDALGLESVGARILPYLWAAIPRRKHSEAFVRQLFGRYSILLVPGHDFGGTGEGYVRLSLTAGSQAYEAALKRARRRRLLKPREEQT